MTTTPRKPRRKVTTEAGRQIMQRERQRLAREQAAIGEAIAQTANATRANRQVTHVRVSPERAAISRGIVRRVAAVLASEGVNLPINVRPADRDVLSAWTDFRTIDVTYRNHDDKRLVAATLRGCLYHEGGHCRFTLPLPDLNKQAVREGMSFPHSPSTYMRAWNCLEDQRMETAVVSDSPRKAAYITPLILTEHVSTIDNMAANYPLLVWRRYLPKRVRREARRMFVIRHNLANQDGEALARECEQIVTNYVLATTASDMLAQVVLFQSFLERIQPLASDMSRAGHQSQRSRHNYTSKKDDDSEWLTIPISPDMLQEDDEDDDDQDDDHDDDDVCDDDEAVEPRSLTDLADDDVFHIMEVLAASMLSPETLVKVRYAVPQSQQPEQGEQGEQDDEQGPGSLLDEDQGMGSQGQAGNEDDDASEGGEGSKDGAGEGSQDDTDDDSEVGGHGSHTDDGSDVTEDDAAGGDDDSFDQDDLDQMLQDAEAERDSQADLNADMRSYSDALNNQTSLFEPYVGGTSSDGEAIARGDVLAEDIERSFHEHTMDRQPGWVEGQRRGIVNVLRYETRQPGDTEFFRAWTEDDNPGFNLSVSLMLDYSSSMSNYEKQLAECGYATKRACDRLGIPCTVTLWDESARVLFDADDQAEHMPVIDARGGTDPATALADLDNQRADRENHIVLIMTDGEWSSEWPGIGWDGRPTRNSNRHLAAFKDSGRTIVGFGFSPYGGNLAAGLLAKGCDEAFSINDLMEIPRHLERLLVDLA